MEKKIFQFQVQGYKIVQIIGQGQFGIIALIQQPNKKQLYVCKIQKSRNLRQILVQRQYKLLKKLEPTNLFPKVYSLYIKDGKSYVIMQYLYQNLEFMKKQYHGKFSMKTVALLAQQLFNIMESLHNHNYIHRDLKPENILLSHNSHSIYLIDFGLSKQCIPLPRRVSGLIGNVRYASIRSHLGYSSKKDDLQSLCYVLIYLLVGRLPWQDLGVNAINLQLKRKNFQGDTHEETPLLKKKMQLNINDFQNINFHKIGTQFLKQLLELLTIIKKYDIPDYTTIRWHIKKLSFISGALQNNCFDWCPRECKNKKCLKQYQSVFNQ